MKKNIFTPKQALNKAYQKVTIHRKDFNKKVEFIFSLKKHNPYQNVLEQENELNNMIYKLYNLTPEEIKIVEENTN